MFVAIDRPQLARDPRFATNEARIENIDELDSILGEWVGARTLQEVMQAFEAHEAAASPVYDVQQIFSDMQYRSRGTLARVPDDDLGEVVMPEVHPHLSETPGAIRHTGRPRGAANADVFQGELGLSEEELRGLEDDGVI
jgi:formyl-CoA transferase